jgi:hypothetical protein
MRAGTSKRQGPGRHWDQPKYRCCESAKEIYNSKYTNEAEGLRRRSSKPCTLFSCRGGWLIKSDEENEMFSLAQLPSCCRGGCPIKVDQENEKFSPTAQRSTPSSCRGGCRIKSDQEHEMFSLAGTPSSYRGGCRSKSDQKKVKFSLALLNGVPHHLVAAAVRLSRIKKIDKHSLAAQRSTPSCRGGCPIKSGQENETFGLEEGKLLPYPGYGSRQELGRLALPRCMHFNPAIASSSKDTLTGQFLRWFGNRKSDHCPAPACDSDTEIFWRRKVAQNRLWAGIARTGHPHGDQSHLRRRKLFTTDAHLPHVGRRGRGETVGGRT